MAPAPVVELAPELADIPAVRPPVSEAPAARSAAPSYEVPPVVAAVQTASLSPVELTPAPSVAPVSAPASAVEALPARIEDAAASLLSETAGAQVAKSFNELAAVFDGLERRSVEEMAQEMLRPMLQEWLDDNLPTLVERLVREEIERVARGARR